MSHSDSDGFESAEDDDFGSAKPATTVEPVAAAAASESQKKSVESTKNKSTTIKGVAKKQGKDATVNDKFKALDVNDEKETGGNDDWGWDENDDWASNDAPTGAVQSSSSSSKRGPDSSSARTQPPPPPPPAARPTSIQQAQGDHRSFSNVQSQPETPSAWSPWSGMVSLLSTASTNVASFTSHVSSAIGIPDPEKFAQQQQQDPDKCETSSQNSDDSKCSSGNNSTKAKPAPDNKHQSSHQQQQPPSEETLLNLGSFVSNVTSISNRVIAGGLDTLEGIGKKTMTIIQENDAGLISKRKLLGLDNQKPVLSQVLREAKEKSEESEKTMKLTQKKRYKKQLHFETLFDDYHGLVHLEALEMLSKQASLKLQALLMPLSGIALNELQQTMNSVSELCELNELDQEDSPTHLYDVGELEEKLKAATEDFDIPIDFTDILT